MPPDSDKWLYIKVRHPFTSTREFTLIRHRCEQPIAGHVVCNIGDALAIFSGGILRSNVHRVMCAPVLPSLVSLLMWYRPPPGEQSCLERYSISFFTRPGNDVVLKSLGDKSGLVASAVANAPEGQYDTSATSGEWIARRIRRLRIKNRTVRTLCTCANVHQIDLAPGYAQGPQTWYASMGTEHSGVRNEPVRGS